ncbi:MAG: DUF4395 domain-containing protein [Actinomycetes bacterium]
MTSTSSGPATRRSGILSFPNPVDERAARTVATGVVAMALAVLVLRQWWVLVPLAYGFVARVASGPRFSPLGLLATRVVVPRLRFAPKYCAGPPKRFAQAIGAACSLTALVLHFVVGADTAALVVLVVLTVAASLEAFVGFCLGCWMFGRLMRAGLIPDDVCEECNDISRRLAA